VVETEAIYGNHLFWKFVSSTIKPVPSLDLDAEENTIIPLAAYADVERSKAAAFEMAHAAGKSEDPEQAQREIFANADGVVSAFTSQE
jgi:hypothetical protein